MVLVQQNVLTKYVLQFLLSSASIVTNDFGQPIRLLQIYWTFMQIYWN